MTKQFRGARINVVLALGRSRIGEIPLSRFKPMTATVTSGLVPEPLRCFARVVDRFELADLDEFSEPATSEGVLVISSDLVTPDGEVKPSPVVQQLRERARNAKVTLALAGLISESRVRPANVPKELDALITDGEKVAEHIADAVQRLAPRIWLMLPVPKKPPIPEGAEAASDIVIDFPRTIDDFRAVLTLRYAIYRTLGYLPSSMLDVRSELDLDAFDSKAIHLLARDTTTGDIVGCARLIVPDGMFSVSQRQAMMYPAHVDDWCNALAAGEVSRIYRDILKRGTGGSPLPAASMGAYDLLRDALKLSHPGLRAEDCCELSRLIVSPKVRGQGLSRRLTEAAVRVATAWIPRTIMIIECREHHRKLYEHFGFQVTTDAPAEPAGLLNAQVIAMWCDLKKAGSQRPHKPNAQVVTSSLTQFRHRPDDPVLHLRGTIPAEAWIWSCDAEPTAKSAQAGFDLSLHNHGLAMATVQALTDLLTRGGGKCISIQSERGDSVEVTATGSDVLPQVLKLLSTV